MKRLYLWIAVCAACADPAPRVPSIRLGPVTTLGSTTGPAALSAMPTSYAQDGRGRYFLALAEAGAPELVRVYDSTGRFLQAIGRLGDGPGEYQRPALVVAFAGDSVLIVDNQARRLSVLDPALRFVRSTTVPGQVSAAVATGSADVIINAPLLVLRGRPQVIARVGTDGVIRGTLEGDSLTCQGSDCPWRGARVLASGAQGEVWAARQFYRYEIERFDAGGHRTKHFVPPAEWFPPYDSLTGTTPTRAPMASVMGLSLDGAGRLWVIGRAANPEWARTLGPERRGEGGRRYFPMRDREKAFDGVIEVRDTSDGHLIAARRLTNQPYWTVIGRNLAHVRTDDDGWSWVDVVSPTLAPGSRP